jgi:hypothetical protein
MLVFGIVVVLVATVALVGIVTVVRRAVHRAAEDCRRLSRVEAVLTLDDELLVSLTSDASGESRWLHSQMSVPAVVMLARWRDTRMPIDVRNEGQATVLRPTAAVAGLRFREQTAVEVEPTRLS